VCSLQSANPKTPVILKNFLDENEEWILEAVKPDPPAPDVTGLRRIVSVAYKDRAFDNVSTSMFIFLGRLPQTRDSDFMTLCSRFCYIAPQAHWSMCPKGGLEPNFEINLTNAGF
jgi:hypothetical protein